MAHQHAALRAAAIISESEVAGLNAPIPEGASFGYHPGGWGKPPVDRIRKALVREMSSGPNKRLQKESFRPEDTGGHWGELPDEDEEDDYDDDEGFEAVGWGRVRGSHSTTAAAGGGQFVGRVGDVGHRDAPGWGFLRCEWHAVVWLGDAAVH